MKKVAVVIVILLTMFGGKLYAQGIKFNRIPFEEALLKAKEQDKLIFVDFYTVWCGPCKGMSKGVFPDAKVGELYNKEFINLKLDAEKEGRAIAKKYGVTAYPTLMFINGDGEMVYKKVGGLNIETTLKMGKSAIESVNSEYSLGKLLELYPQKQNDEKFLKLYFNKMMEYGESPIEGIEAWLKIQTEIKEADVDMMEFLMKHGKYLMVDGKAEEIYNTNFDEFMSIATRAEESSLKNMKANMVRNTKGVAYKERSPELLRAFIENWKKLPQGINVYGGSLRPGNEMDFELDYLLFKKDYKAYKKQAAIYIDSIMNAKTLEQMRIDDQLVYEEYKTNRYSPSLIGDAVLSSLKKGKEANMQMKAIEKTGYIYLKQCKNKKDFKRLLNWIDYGSQLIELDYSMDNMRARVLYQQGKTKKAIEYKKSALAKLSDRHKKRPHVQKELDKMLKGEKL